MLKKLVFSSLILMSLIFTTTCRINTPRFSTEEMQNICNLAVMDCYFHNIAKFNKPAENFMAKDKTIWFEYTARVKFGIDASQIDVQVYKDKVTIRLPQPKALQAPNIIDNTIKPYSSQDGFIKTRITPEERLSAQDMANQNMIRQLNENSSLVQKAENRIKIILGNYIHQIGEFSGIEYKIEWVRI